jgi:hypothetical protein
MVLIEPSALKDAEAAVAHVPGSSIFHPLGVSNFGTTRKGAPN